jgi:hypothetical protein
MALFNLFGFSKAPSKQPELKTINYRGGVVTFRVPSHWREDYARDGGADFYDEAPDSPTFRLAVTTLQAPSPITAVSAPEVLAGLRQASHGIERLPNGLALIRYTEPAEDRGHRLLITYWLVANPIPPSHARLATFSFTTLERQQRDPSIQATIQTLDREVRAATFATEIGVTPK